MVKLIKYISVILILIVVSIVIGMLAAFGYIPQPRMVVVIIGVFISVIFLHVFVFKQFENLPKEIMYWE